jgi:hypothetical protein
MGTLDAFVNKQSVGGGALKASAKTAKGTLDLFVPGSAPIESAPASYQAPTTPVGDFSFGDSLERGVDILKSNLQAAVGDFDEADKTIDSTPKAGIQSYQQVDGVGDAIQFVGEKTLESLPSTGLGLLGGLIGFLTPVPGGTAIGAAIGTGLPLLGESRKAIKDEGGDPSVTNALVPTAVKTGLEFVRVMQIAKALGLGKVFNKAIKEGLEEVPKAKGVLARVKAGAKDIPVQGTSEGLVEVGQELTDTVASKFFADKDFLSLDPTDQQKLKEAFFGGLAGGVGTATVAHPVGAGLDVVGDKLATAKKEKVLKRIDTEAEKIITEEIEAKRKALAEQQQILQDTANRFNPFATSVILPDVYGKPLGGKLTKGVPTPKDSEGPYLEVDPTIERRSKTTKVVKANGDYGVETFWQDVTEPGVYIQKHTVEDKRFEFEGFNHKEFMEIGAKVIERLNETFGLKDAKIFLADRESLSIDGMDINYGPNGFMARTDTENGALIGIDLRKIADGYSDYLQGTEKENANRLARTALQVLSHEYGHYLMGRKWESLDTTTRSALLQGYRDWLDEIKHMTWGEFLEHYNPFQIGVKISDSVYNEPFIDILKRLPPNKRSYLTSFDEYAAQTIAKVNTGRLVDMNMSDQEKSFWQEMFETFKRIWEEVKSAFEWKTDENFSAWLMSLELEENIRQLEQQLSDLREGKAATKEFSQGVKSKLMEELGISKSKDVETDYDVGEALNAFGLSMHVEDLNQQGDVFLGFMRLAKILTPLQLAELAKRSGIQNAADYMNQVKEYANTKNKATVRADEIAQKWRALGKTESTKLGNFLFAVSEKSDELGRRLYTVELESLKDKFGLDDETFELWKEIDQSFADVLTDIEKGLILDAAYSFIEDPAQAREFRDRYIEADGVAERVGLITGYTGEGLVSDQEGRLANPLFEELNRIQQSVDKLRQRNYFPRSRLGEYTIVIKSTAEGQEWEGVTSSRAEERLGFYTFDSKRERDEMLKVLTPDATRAGLSITGGKISSEAFSMMGMPEVLIQQTLANEIKAIETNPNLSDAEKRRAIKALKDRMSDVSLNLSPGKKFLKHLKKRRGIAGFNTDALRVYSNYMLHAANHLARVEHAKSMIRALQEFDKQIRQLEATGQGIVLDDLSALRDYYRRHFDYIMRPENDWANLRAIGFLWYLGFNVKSALINLTQIPMITFPFLGAKYGDLKAMKTLGKSYRDVTNFLRGKEGLSAGEKEMLDTLRDAGVIDESMVMELAGMGEADVLKRAIPGFGFDNLLNRVSYYGGAMFRMGEKYNRYVTAVAAYRLALENGQDGVAFAREAIEKTQFEYTKWNRPEFMRGKKSVIFLFWQYMQHASFLFFGGEGSKVAMRIWLLALFIAGVEGLPFAKTLLDLLNASGTQMKKLFGSADPRVALEEDMRDLLLEITDKPDLILNGMASYWGLGPLHLASQMGIPVPNIDVSGSLSFGSPVPFLDEALKGNGSPDEELGKFTAALLGPVAGIPLQAYRSATSTDPDTWKAIERTLPTFIKNALQGGRWLLDEKETFRGGGEFLSMDKPEDRVASIMKMLGFQPTKLTQKYKQVTATQEAALYYTLRKSLLLQDYAYAITIKDREAKADVMKQIRKFNESVKGKGFAGLGISGKDMKRSIKARLISQKRRELGLAPTKRQQALYEETQRLFPVG